MANFDFLTIHKDKTLAFMQAWYVARENYVAARVCFQQKPIGIAYSGCLLAEQCVEMFIKAILHVDHKSTDVHYLPKLLDRGKGKIAYFDKLLTDPKLSYFIENLLLVYNKMRFGEAGFTVKQDELIQVLDEVAFNLNESYLAVMENKDKPPLYVPDAMREAFLCNNKFFGENDISNELMASMPPP